MLLYLYKVSDAISFNILTMLLLLVSSLSHRSVCSCLISSWRNISKYSEEILRKSFYYLGIFYDFSVISF